MLNPKTQFIELSQNEYIRYSKQLILHNINVDGQKRIKKSKILVIGAGGLSNPIIIYLAASGIGCIGLVDRDDIELSNLNRQIIYTKMDINKSKVELARTRINKINNNCKIIKHEYKIDEHNAKETIRYYDIVIDTTDNFQTRYIIDKACYRLGKTYIYGAVDQFIGQVGIFNYKDGIKYCDLYPEYLDLVQNDCNLNGVMGIITGHIGIIQAAEILKLISGHRNKCDNRIILCDLLNINTKIKKVYKQKYKITKYATKSITTHSKILTPQTSIGINNHQGNVLIILFDIRNSQQFNIKHNYKSINIPLKAFKCHKTLKFITKYSKYRYFYISCETQYKSIIVSNILKSNNINNHYILDRSTL